MLSVLPDYLRTEATLVYCDEPQLISLLHGKHRFVAVRAGHSLSDDFIYTGSRISAAAWDSYLAGRQTLRPLIMNGDLHFRFDLARIGDDGLIRPRPLGRPFRESELPAHGFRASSHTVADYVPMPDEAALLRWQAANSKERV